MLIILSPAKDMFHEIQERLTPLTYSEPEFLTKAEKLMVELKKFNPEQLSKIMNISPKLSLLNYQRIQKWNRAEWENGTPAILTFTGEAYRGLNAAAFDDAALNYAQQTLRLLSGLYGVLRPLDLIQEYRLEMGTKQAFAKKENLYSYWSTSITASLKNAIADSPGEKVLVNLASEEYSSSIDVKKMNCRIVTPIFKQESKGRLQVVTVFAKRARGMMARFIIENQLKRAEELKAFDMDGYFFDAASSTNDKWLFQR
jgi:cytoplasmic iron level regulating protein YaaA (DUF328/UPF0246 family)